MRLSDVVFVEVSDVETEHDRRLAEHGGLAGTRDRGLLESAVMRPRSTFDGVPLYPSLATMAAALTVGVARNHPFVDGNKRTALACGIIFLGLNGNEVKNDGMWVGRMVRVAAGELDVQGLAPFFAQAMGGDVDVESDT